MTEQNGCRSRRTRPPFESDNTAALRHGARSPRRVGPRFGSPRQAGPNHRRPNGTPTGWGRSTPTHAPTAPAASFTRTRGLSTVSDTRPSGSSRNRGRSLGCRSKQYGGNDHGTRLETFAGCLRSGDGPGWCQPRSFIATTQPRSRSSPQVTVAVRARAGPSEACRKR